MNVYKVIQSYHLRGGAETLSMVLLIFDLSISANLMYSSLYLLDSVSKV